MPSESATGNSREKVKSVVSSYVTTASLVLLVFFISIIVIQEVQRDKPVIDNIEVPKELSDKFSTNVAITRQLIDAAKAAQRIYSDESYLLERLPNYSQLSMAGKRTENLSNPFEGKQEQKAGKSKKTEAKKKRLEEPAGIPISNKAGSSYIPVMSEDKDDVDIQLPTVGPLRPIIRFLKAKFGFRDVPHINGEITIQENSLMRLVLRSSDTNALQPEPIQESNKKEVINKGGEALLQLYSPCTVAFYYYQQVLKSRSLSKTSQLISKTSQLIEPCRKTDRESEYSADLLSGLIAYQNEDFDEAIKQYQIAAERKPKSADAYFYKGLALHRKNELDGAKAAYEKALEVEPDFINAYWGLAFFHTDPGKELDNKLQKLADQKLADRNRQKAADIYMFLGDALLDRGKPNDAIDKYKKAINVRKDLARAYNNLGVALYAIDRYDEAISSYQEAINHDSHYADAYYHQGIALANLGKYKEAIDLYRKAIDFNWRLSNAYYFSGIAQLELKNPKGAIEDFEKFLGLEPEAKPAPLFTYWGNAFLLLAKQNPKNMEDFLNKAISKYQEAITADNTYYPAYYNQGIAYDNLGKKGEANDQYQKSQEVKEQYKKIEERHAAGLFAQQNNPSSVPTTETETSPPLFWPWAGGLVALLAGLLVIFFSGVPDKLKKIFGRTPPLPTGGPDEIPSDKPIPTEEKSTPQGRRTQVEKYFPAPGPGRPTAILVCVAGKMQNRQFPIEKEMFRIGANSHNDLCIPDDEYVSGDHAYLRYEKGSLLIYDERSRNGTFVNGQRVSGAARALMQADHIKIGNSMFEVVVT